jgi:hypothetical protein
MNKHSGSSFDDLLKEEGVEIVEITNCAHGKPIKEDCQECITDKIIDDLRDDILELRYKLERAKELIKSVTDALDDEHQIFSLIARVECECRKWLMENEVENE